MATQLRVLMVEDLDSDALLVERALRQGDFDLEAHRAEDRDAFLAALAEPWDVILVDYNVPGLEGPDSIRLAAERQPEVPVGVVTGTLGDEAAVETLKLGATDYVRKGNLRRLVPAVERALKAREQAREHQRLDDQLRDVQRRMAETLSLLETIQSTAPVGLGFVDRDLRAVRANDWLAAMAGLRATDEGGPTMAGQPPMLWPAIEGDLRAVLRTGQAVINREMTGETADEPGRARSWLASYYPVPVDQEVIGVGIVFVDITDLKEANRRRDAAHSAVAAIGAAVEARDRYTAGHQRRVADIAGRIAAELGLDRDEIEGIRLAAAIHDIGKISIPAEILTRPGQLSRQEFEFLKLHPETGYEIVSGIAFPWPIADMILQHHEILDGSGYPRGLTGDEILPRARILRVADVVEAMSSHRPYRPGWGADAAVAEIERGAGSLFDRSASEACVDLNGQGALPLPGWSVEPGSGQPGG